MHLTVGHDYGSNSDSGFDWHYLVLNLAKMKYLDTLLAYRLTHLDRKILFEYMSLATCIHEYILISSLYPAL